MVSFHLLFERRKSGQKLLRPLGQSGRTERGSFFVFVGRRGLVFFYPSLGLEIEVSRETRKR